MKNWYAIYVRPRAEKQVSHFLDQKQVHNYLPLRKSLRQWSDRKKWVELPVISGYIFVNIDQKNRIDVLKTDFVLGFVRYLGADAVINEDEINTMKCVLGQGEYDVQVDFSNFSIGQPVRVVLGPLTGLCGELISVKKCRKVLLRLEQININIIVELPSAHVEVLNNNDGLNNQSTIQTKLIH